MLRTRELEYELPAQFVATRPAQPRDGARLMVVSRSDAARVEHARVRDLGRFLRAGDVLALNRTWVLPARVFGRRVPGGGRVEGLYLSEARPGVWEVLLKSNGRLRADDSLELDDAHGSATGITARLVERKGEGWLAEVSPCDGLGAPAMLERLGATPLPPYILRRRREAHETVDDALDRAWYRTVYERERGAREHGAGNGAGSVAAPTAGLHFTPPLLDALAGAGVRRAEVTLHVGMGTFKPVEAEHVEEHAMHAEWFFAPGETMRAVRETRAAGGRVIGVGTTTARALESVPAGWTSGDVEGETRLLVTPGHEWRWIDGLMTNFHLPRSTLLAMVASLLPEGAPRLLTLYREAMAREYRFYSYGDAMLLLP